MNRCATRLFGSLDHEFPVIEIYLDDEIALEIVTTTDGSDVEVLSHQLDRRMTLEEVKSLLELVLPEWKKAVAQRAKARSAADERGLPE